LKISLLTDARDHNLALMKISAWHKAQGDEVMLNAPIFPADFTYASVLFEKNLDEYSLLADEIGGPAVDGSELPAEIESMMPDYDLYPHNQFSLGYTYRPCDNQCDFCKVPKMAGDRDHHSIHEFYDHRFKTICLLNNNTFQDPRWKETFEEIWELDLSVKDENGYDIRLLDDDKAAALKKTRWDSCLHFSWDRMSDEDLVMHNVEILKRHKIRNVVFHVLIGYNTTDEDDLRRCEMLARAGVPAVYPMPYKYTDFGSRLRRFMFSHFYANQKYKGVPFAESFRDYRSSGFRGQEQTEGLF